MDQHNQFIKALTNPESQESAFKKLIVDYKERLYWHIRKIVIGHDDTDDVLQNTFLKVFENINKFKGNSNIYTWMYRIATNEALNYLGKKITWSEVAGLLDVSKRTIYRNICKKLKMEKYKLNEEI